MLIDIEELFVSIPALWPSSGECALIIPLDLDEEADADVVTVEDTSLLGDVSFSSDLLSISIPC